MADQKGDKPGDVFSFAPEKPVKSGDADGQRDETFTIPSFLRREAEDKEAARSAPVWNDDDFARIAATAEAPQPAPEQALAPDSAAKAEAVAEDHTAAVSEPAVSLVEEAPETPTEPEAQPEPEIAAAPLREEAEVVFAAKPPSSHSPVAPAAPDTVATAEPAAVIAGKMESANAEPAFVVEPKPSSVPKPSFSKPFFKDARPEQDGRESVASRIRSASFFSRASSGEDSVPRVEPEIRIEPEVRAEREVHIEPEIRIEPKDDRPERVEPRIVSTAGFGEQPVGARAPWRGEGFRQPLIQSDDEDRGQRWRLGPALDARDLDSFEDGDPFDAGWRISDEPAERKSPVRWMLLALFVAAGGYAVAHQLDNRSGMTALWSPPANDAVTAFAPPAPSALSSAAPSPAAPARQEAAAPLASPEKPAVASQVVKSPPPVRAAREEAPRRAVESPREAELPRPVTLAPGPRTLSAISADHSGGDVSATGELVLDVQQRLTRLGYGDVALNGRLDTNTRSAIMAFQRANGLPMTGLIDAEVLSRLRHMSPAGMRLVKGPAAITPP